MPARQGVAPLADHFVVAVGQTDDEFVSPGDVSRCLNVRAGGIGSTEGHVVVESLGEQERLVGHLAHCASQPVQPAVTDVYAVDEHRTGGHVVEAGQESGHR